MQPKKSPKHPQANTAGTKLLITAASLTAVVGSWAVFSLQDTANLQQSSQASENGPMVISLPPLPTLVARPGEAAQSRPPAVDASVSGSEPSAPLLRSVTIPQPSDNQAPLPVTNTRSSR